MFKRLSWLTMGTGVGFGLAVWGRRKLAATIEHYRPSALTSTWTKTLRRFGDDLRAAGHEGRSAMHERELELRSSSPNQRFGDELGEPAAAGVAGDRMHWRRDGTCDPRS